MDCNHIGGSPPDMRILSINVSKPKAASYKGKDVITGIYKKPLQVPVWLRKANIEGDTQADLNRHGGFDKAVYAFPYEHYAFYHKHLGQDCNEYGEFGENLTIEGMVESTVHIGDRFQIGAAIIEVSQPRAPCFKLAMKMGTDKILRLMLDSGKTGFYLRVIKEGLIEAGEVSCVSSNETAQSVEGIHKLMFFEIMNVSELKRALSNPALGQALQDEFAKSEPRRDSRRL